MGESQRMTTPPEMSKPVRHIIARSFSDPYPMGNPDRFSGPFAKASDPMKPLRSQVVTSYEPLSNKMKDLLAESGFECVYSPVKPEIHVKRTNKKLRASFADSETVMHCAYGPVVDKRKLVTLGVTKALKKRRTRYEVMSFLRDCFWEKLPRKREAFLKRLEETLNNIAERDSDRYRRVVSTIYSTLDDANII